MKIIDGKACAQQIKAQIAKEVEMIKAIGFRVPKLAIILVGDRPDSMSYVKSKEKTCLSLGMDCQTYLLPATTALGTLDPIGREKGILAGANVIMPNLSPVAVRKKYELYDNKICTGDDSAKCRGCIEARVASIGYSVVMGRGDHPAFTDKE